MSEDWRVSEMALLTERVVKLEALLAKAMAELDSVVERHRHSSSCNKSNWVRRAHLKCSCGALNLYPTIIETLREIREARKSK